LSGPLWKVTNHDQRAGPPAFFPPRFSCLFRTSGSLFLVSPYFQGWDFPSNVQMSSGFFHKLFLSCFGGCFLWFKATQMSPFSIYGCLIYGPPTASSNLCLSLSLRLFFFTHVPPLFVEAPPSRNIFFLVCLPGEKLFFRESSRGSLSFSVGPLNPPVFFFFFLGHKGIGCRICCPASPLLNVGWPPFFFVQILPPRFSPIGFSKPQGTIPPVAVPAPGRPFVSPFFPPHPSARFFWGQ